MVGNSLVLASVIVGDFNSVLDKNSKYIFVIYQRDDLFEGMFAVRPYKLGGIPQLVRYVVLAETLEEARTVIPTERLVQIPACATDPADLVETWC